MMEHVVKAIFKNLVSYNVIVPFYARAWCDRLARVLGVLSLPVGSQGEFRHVLVYTDTYRREASAHASDDPAFIREFEGIDMECRGARLYRKEWPHTWLDCFRMVESEPIYVTFSRTGFQLKTPSWGGWEE